jgi:hypothetical protein
MEQELYHALQAIESRDPDGGEREPTEAAYLYHEKWAVETFGREVWERYAAGSWEPQ